jgi:YbbR domain-containing protein
MATIGGEGLRKRLTILTGAAVRLGQSIDLATILRLLLAIALAFALWTYVTLRNNPEVTVPLRGRPVEARGLASSAVLITSLPAVDITVAGPQVLIDAPARPITAYVDLAGLPIAGNQRLPVKVDLPRGVSLVGVNPDEVVVDLEPLVTAEFPVTMVSIALPAGVSMQQPLIEPRAVSVSAARSTLAQIERVVVRPDLGGDPNDRVRITRPIPLSATGQEVTGPKLEIEPKLIKVTLPGRTVQSQKTVPVRYTIKGQPYPGYQIGSIQTTPALVNIIGEPEVLQNISALETEPLDITDRRQTLTQTVPLKIPPGVQAEQSAVQVEVGIAPIEARVRLTLTVFPLRLGAGLRAQVVQGSVDVTLKGPVPRIQEIDVGALRAEVDLQGLGAGTHQVVPRIIGPGLDRLEVVGVQPARVTVQIAAEPTAAPPTPAVTPAVTPSPGGGPAPR